MSKPRSPVMIFGAGFGTRMRELTKDRPKPLVQVAGTALIDYALALAGTRSCVVNTHYHADQMAAHLAGRENVSISHEDPDILETGGGLRAALPLLGTGTVLTLNSDAIWSGPNPLDMLQSAWDPDRMDALLLMVPLPRTVGFTRPGDFAIDVDGQLKRDNKGMVYSGAQILKTGDLHKFKETSFSLNLLWNNFDENNRLFGIEYPGHWADVGTPEGIPLAEQLIEMGHHV